MLKKITQVAAFAHAPLRICSSLGTSRAFDDLCLTRKMASPLESAMIDPVIIPETDGLEEPSVSGVSWGAVAAGAAVSSAITLVVIAFGIGLGFTVVSPWAGSGISATTFKIGTGLFLVVIAMFSSSLGGYIAGRLRSRWIGVHSDEVYFRDTAHGFIAWAFATLLGAVLLTSPVGSLLGGAVSGVTQGAASAAQTFNPTDGYVDTLLRSDNSAASNSGSDPRGEIVRLFVSNFRNGTDFKSSDREYIAKIVATRTGLSQADADKRVNDVITQAKSDIDSARKATAQLAFWLTASLLIGAFCSSLAATEGGGLRDGTWGRKPVRKI
jgi:hypothetical protein